jgi:S-formylglutathione hydrolase FrmB
MSLTLFLMYQSIWAVQIDTVQIYSAAMKKESPALVMLPDSYSGSDRAYPVIYLLHGRTGDYTNWYAKTDVATLADRYDVIIVCPDGAPDSWYVDSKIDPASQYQTHIAREVVAFTDARYRTIKTPAGRAITGLSMGGHGALLIAAKYPDTFGAAGSMSGVVDIREFAGHPGITAVLGDFETHRAEWDAQSVRANVERFKSSQIPLIIDCGIQDRFIEVNRKLHQDLIDAGVAHDFIERFGGHSWDYWGNAIHYQVLFFARFFNGNRHE